MLMMIFLLKRLVSFHKNLYFSNQYWDMIWTFCVLLKQKYLLRLYHTLKASQCLEKSFFPDLNVVYHVLKRRWIVFTPYEGSIWFKPIIFQVITPKESDKEVYNGIEHSFLDLLSRSLSFLLYCGGYGLSLLKRISCQ